MKTWIGALVLVLLAIPARAQEKQTLVIKSEVEDNKGGMVLVDGAVVALMVPGEEWGITLPHHLLQQKRFAALEILFCEPFTVQIPAPPSWTLSADAAGPHAFTEEFLRSAPMPFEFAERVAYIGAFLEGEKHPDAANMKKKLAMWAAGLANLEMPCRSPIKLAAPVPNANAVRFVLKGRQPGYLLVPVP